MKREGKEMKKIFSVIIAVFMVATLTTKPIFAKGNQGITFNDENFTYKVSSDANKTVSVSKKNLEIETCDIPKTVENNGITYTVTSIRENGFRELTNLKTVNIPDSVTIIGEAAFHKCNQLTSIYVPDSVTTIGKSAFSQCPQLQTIRISESVTTLSGSIFAECKSLKTVNLPKKLTKLEENVFYYCESLESIVIPEDVTSIGENVFYGCRQLSSVTIPNDINFVGDLTFEDCKKINQVLAMQNSTSTTDGVAQNIRNQIKKSNPTYYLGVTDIKLKQSSIAIHPNDTLNLNESFTVSATVKDNEGNPTDTVAVPQEYLQPQYSLVSGATGETRIEDDKLIVDPQQKNNLIVKATLNKQEVELSVNVIQSPIKNIEMSQEPRLAYVEGDTFDPTGLQLKVNYENGTSDIVEYNENTKNDFTFVVNSPLTLSDTKVVIKYANHSVEQALTIYRKAIIVTPDQNSITGLEDKYEQGDALNVIVNGAGMDNQEPTEGDTRYKPVSWQISTLQQFVDDSYEISMDTNYLQLGNHQLKVIFEKEIFNGDKWVAKETFELVKSFEVVEASQKEITPTPTPTPTQTPNTNSTPKETTKTSVVSTEDSTFVIGFAALVVVTGSILFVSFKNKKSKKMQ